MGLPTVTESLRAQGFSLVPGTLDKRPKVEWGQWRDRQQTDEEFADLGHGSVWGIVTGQAHGLVVLDFDGAEGVELATSLGLKPNVITGSGGWHVWLDASAIPYPVKTCAGVRPGLDVRGEGGLVWVAGRSRKGAYNVIDTYRREGASQIAPLLDLLPERTAPTGDADFGEWDGEGEGTDAALRVLRAQRDKVAETPSGQRNAALNRAAFTLGGLVASGELGYRVAADALAHACGRWGLGVQEQDTNVIRAGLGAGMQSPWSAEPEVDEDGETWLSTSDIPKARGAVTAPEPRLELPLDAFPKEVQQLARDGAPVLSAPPQYIALATLPALATAIGGLVTLKLRSTWRIPPSLYLALVGPPGASKSPAIDLALTPAAKANEDMWDADPKGDARLVLEDVTIERLADLLSANPRGLLYYADELKGFFAGMGQYKEGGGADRQFYLKAWNGKSIQQARVKRGDLYVPRANLNVLGGIQPSVLDQMSYDEPDGMMERFLMVYADSMPGAWTEEDIPDATLTAYTELWHDLRDNCDQEREVPLTADGRATWASWYNAFERDPGLPEHMLYVRNKVRTHVARIALVLAECEGSDCNSEHVERAIAITEYLLDQADLVYRIADSSTRDTRQWVKAREKLTQFIESHVAEHGEPPTRSHILNRGPSYSRKKSVLDPMLEELGVVL